VAYDQFGVGETDLNLFGRASRDPNPDEHPRQVMRCMGMCVASKRVGLVASPIPLPTTGCPNGSIVLSWSRGIPVSHVVPIPISPAYQRRRPEAGVLYQVIRENYRTFASLREEEGRPLPRFVERAFEKYLACGILSKGFARVHCKNCGYDRLVGFSCKGRGFCPSCLGRRMNDGAAFLSDRVLDDTPVRHWVLSLPPPLRYLLAYDPALVTDVVTAFIRSVFAYLRRKAKATLGLESVTLAHPGAVTVIQRCSGHLALNVHFHSLITDGVFIQESPDGPVDFQSLPPPGDDEITAVAWDACRRTRDVLVRRGLWQEDVDDGEDDPLLETQPGLADLCQASLRGVLALGPRRGQRVVQFFGQAASGEDVPDLRRRGYGFNLDARQSVPAGDRDGLERLARYLLRPPLAQTRLKRRSDGRVMLRLKRPWRNGTEGMIFEPIDFLAKLAVLVPPPRMNTIRFHGVYAPNARLRSEVVPAREDDACENCTRGEGDETRDSPYRQSWARLLARVFSIDVLECPRCASRMQRIAWMTESATIRKILRSVGLSADSPELHPALTAEELFYEDWVA